MGGSQRYLPFKACRNVVFPDSDGPTIHQFRGEFDVEGSSKFKSLKRGGFGRNDVVVVFG